MQEFTRFAECSATGSPSPAPLTIAPALLADPTLSWLERVLLARIAAGGSTRTADLAEYLEREPGTVRNLIASLVRRGYLNCQFEPDPEKPWRPVRFLLSGWGGAENSAPLPERIDLETELAATVTRDDLPCAENSAHLTSFDPPSAENSAPPTKNEAPDPSRDLPGPQFTLEFQASSRAWGAVPRTVPLPLRGIAAASSSSTGTAKADAACTDSAPAETPSVDRSSHPQPAAAGCKQEGEGEDVSPGTGRLLAAGVDYPEALRLGELPLPQISGAIARMRREGKGIGWLVKCLREGWRVDLPTAPAGTKGEPAAVQVTRAYREQLRHEGTWDAPAEEESEFEAMRRSLGNRLAKEETTAREEVRQLLARRAA